MSTLLLDMPSGIAGDMLLGALCDLGGDLAQVERDLLGLNIGPIRIASQRVLVSGISAMQIDVAAEQEPTWTQPAHQVGPLRMHGPAATTQALSTAAQAAHVHRPYAVIRAILSASTLPERVKSRAQRVFQVLATGEATVHGVAVDEVTFHEVGSLDAIADVVGCCLLLEQLGIDRVVSGPIMPGEGSVWCAHGRMPVPVPAVAAMLAQHAAPQRRVTTDTGELTTPTGCALVIGLHDAWLDELGVIYADGVGYGAGHKRFPDRANIVRVHRLREVPAEEITDDSKSFIYELHATIDDMTGEDLALVQDELLHAGALDVHIIPVLMKKNRPGYDVVVLAADADRERLATLVVTRTTSIGVRWRRMERLVLQRTYRTVTVLDQTVRLKIVTLPDGTTRMKPEADDVAALVRTSQRPVQVVRELIQQAARSGT